MTQDSQFITKIIVHDQNEAATQLIGDCCRDESGERFCDLCDEAIDLIADPNTAEPDLGALFLCDETPEDELGALEIVKRVHQARKNLPIFLRLTQSADLESFAGEYASYFSGTYRLEQPTSVTELVDRFLRNTEYPEVLVEHLQSVGQDAIMSTVLDVDVEVNTPFMTREHLAGDGVCAILPISVLDAHGFVAVQMTERDMESFMYFSHLTTRQTVGTVEPEVCDDVIQEITNGAWGIIKRTFESSEEDRSRNVAIPMILNFSQRHINFGNQTPKLCFTYTLRDKHKEIAPVKVYMKAIFNGNWDDERIAEMQDKISEPVQEADVIFL